VIVDPKMRSAVDHLRGAVFLGLSFVSVTSRRIDGAVFVTSFQGQQPKSHRSEGE